MTLPQYIGSGSAAAGTANINVSTNGTNCLPGDLLLLAVQSSNQAISAPSGWTEVPDSPQGTGTAASAGAVRLGVFYKWADYADSVSPFGTHTVTDTGDHTLGIIHAFRGVSRSGPFDVTSGGTEANSDTTLSATGDTTTVADCLIAVLVANSIDGQTTDQASSWANADLANVTVRTGANTPQITTGTGGGLNLTTGEKATAGTFGATTATYANNANYGFISLALAPAKGPYLVGIGTLSTSTGATAAPPWPSGHASGDVGLCFVETAGGEPVPATPSGWNTVTNSPQATGAGTAGTQLTVYERRATSGSETAPTFGDAGDHVLAFIITFRNCATSGSAIDVTAGSVKASASTSVSVSGVTTTQNDELVIYATTRDNDSATAEYSSWADASLAAFVEAYDAGSLTGNGGGFGIAMGVLATAGATGTATATMTNSNVNAHMVIALKKAATAGTGGRSWVQVW